MFKIDLTKSAVPLIAGAAVFSACAAEDTACLTDVDCDQGQVCRASTCTTLCVVDSDCADGEECVSRGPDESRACRSDLLATGEDGDEEDGANTWILLIRSGSTDCSSETPGPDIVGASVLGTGGTVVARAEALLGDNPEHDLNRIDAAEPTQDCANSGLSMGCESWVALRLVDNKGLSAPLSGFTDSLQVDEWGESCRERADESYTVYRCLIPGDVENNDDISSCTDEIGSAAGPHKFEVI